MEPEPQLPALPQKYRSRWGGRASGGWSGSKKVVRCGRSAFGRGEAAVVPSGGGDGKRGLACRVLVSLRLLREAVRAAWWWGPTGAVWPREHGVCAAWAHNGRAAPAGCLGADGPMGEFGHRSSDRGGEGWVIGGKLAPRDSGCQPDGLPKLRCVGRGRDGVCGLERRPLLRDAVVREVELSTASPAECSKRFPAAVDAWLCGV